MSATERATATMSWPHFGLGRGRYAARDDPRIATHGDWIRGVRSGFAAGLARPLSGTRRDSGLKGDACCPFTHWRSRAGCKGERCTRLRCAMAKLDPREQLLLSLDSEPEEPAVSLQVISPEEVGERIVDPQARRALIQRLVLMSALDEEIRPEELATVRKFAKALAIDEPG